MVLWYTMVLVQSHHLNKIIKDENSREASRTFHISHLLNNTTLKECLIPKIDPNRVT